MAKYYEIIINDELVGKLAISEQAIARLQEKDKEEQDFVYDLCPEWFVGTLEVMMRDDFSKNSKVIEKEMI
jgi:hypothetical protein